MRPSPLLVVRVIMGDGASTGEKEESEVGEGDLDEAILEALGLDFDRNDRDDSLSAGNGGVIFNSVTVETPGLLFVGFPSLGGDCGFVVLVSVTFREAAGSIRLESPRIFCLVCLRLEKVEERAISGWTGGGLLEALLLLLLMNPSNTGIVMGVRQ